MSEDKEPLMNLKPQSDFELLLWDRNKNKELTALLRQCYENLGVLQSDLAELKDLIATPGKKQHVKHITELQRLCKERAVEIERYKEMYMKKNTENKRLVEQMALLNKKYGLST